MLRSEPCLVHSRGFIPRTLAGDARPLEVVVFAPWMLDQLSLFGACQVGVLTIFQAGIAEPGIIGVSADSICCATVSIRNADDIEFADRARIAGFSGCETTSSDREFCTDWANACRARDVVRAAVRVRPAWTVSLQMNCHVTAKSGAETRKTGPKTCDAERSAVCFYSGDGILLNRRGRRLMMPAACASVRAKRT